MFDREAVLALLTSAAPTHDERQWKSVALVRSLLEHAAEPAARDHFHPGHLTASAWVLHPHEDRILAIHHRRLDRWLPPGGHLEPGESPAAAARREALEETSVSLRAGGPEILVRVDVHAIPPARGEPLHYHHDLGFAFLAASPDLARQEEEVHDLAWLPFDEAARRDAAFHGAPSVMTEAAATLRRATP